MHDPHPTSVRNMVPTSSALTALQNNGDLMSSMLVAIAPGPQQPNLNLHMKPLSMSPELQTLDSPL